MEVIDLKKQFAEEERLLAAGLEVVRSHSSFFLPSLEGLRFPCLCKPEKGDGNGGPPKKKFRPNAFRADEGEENNGTTLPVCIFSLYLLCQL